MQAGIRPERDKMQQLRNGALGALVLLAGLSTALTPSFAKETAAADRIDPLSISSFSGAFLAARTAEIDKDFDSATLYYKRALTLDPDNRDVERSLFLGLLSKGDFQQSLKYAEKLKLERGVARFSSLALGVDAMRKRDYAKADQLFGGGIDSDLDRLVTGLLTGWAKLGRDAPKSALETLDKLDGPPWFSLFVSYHRALIAEAGGLDEEARRTFEDTLANQDAGGAAPDTYLRAAEAYAGFLARKGEKEAALKVLDTADTFVGGRIPILKLREQIQADQKVGKLFAAPADGAAEAMLNVAAALNQSGGEAFVRVYLQFAHALNPKSDMILLQLASIAEQQMLPEEAIALYGKISDASPIKRAAELQIGLNLADLKQYDEAIKHLRIALEQDKTDMRAYLALGGVYSGQENYKAASEVYDEAAASLSAPVRANWNIFYQRGIAYERLKQWDKAEPNFRKALELYPDQPQVLNYLGYSWVDMNRNLDEGLDMIKRAVELRPSDGYIVDSLGWAYYRLGRFEEAVTELERAVSLKPDDPVLNDHLGDAYWRVGRKLEATFQWSHAIDREPTEEELPKIREKLAKGLPDLPDPAAAKADPAAPAPVDPDKKG
jgi:tetratricopeptide (TPR) repeat protein